MGATSTAASQIRELSAGETRLAHHAMRALRPAYEDQQQFAEHVDGVLRPASYRPIGVFLPDEEQAVAVAGFRIGDNLAWGQHLYVDDISTAPHRRK